MIRIMSAFILAMLSALCAAADPDIQLADGAPGRHVVLPGDTLWGLSTTFLKDPWRWSEIWQMNREQIRSPHRIYPGDVILLERDLQGRPRLRLQSAKLAPQVHVEKNPQAIPTIAPNVIRPFLSEPLIVEADSLDRSARIVAAQEDRVNLGNGDRAYVIGAEPATENWQVFRNGKPLLDPVNKEVLGYEAFYLGTAKQRQPGEPATFEIISAK
ncbi:MAG TPA: LysM peptidoglycan-binding domain-containing protein, partial [Accumulibacter sp.]|nr:LysM peptidoglycan-binding domain-containing protein [Accumulibacter sp.]